jgi:hypothetical protein
MDGHNRYFNNILKLYFQTAYSFLTLYIINTVQTVMFCGPQLSLEKYHCMRMLIYIIVMVCIPPFVAFYSLCNFLVALF